jgi:flagellar biosynthesis component FlhA
MSERPCERLARPAAVGIATSIQKTTCGHGFFSTSVPPLPSLILQAISMFGAFMYWQVLTKKENKKKAKGGKSEKGSKKEKKKLLKGKFDSL